MQCKENPFFSHTSLICHLRLLTCAHNNNLEEQWWLKYCPGFCLSGYLYIKTDWEEDIRLVNKWYSLFVSLFWIDVHLHNVWFSVYPLQRIVPLQPPHLSREPQIAACSNMTNCLQGYIKKIIILKTFHPTLNTFLCYKNPLVVIITYSDVALLTVTWWDSETLIRLKLQRGIFVLILLDEYITNSRRPPDRTAAAVWMMKLVVCCRCDATHFQVSPRVTSDTERQITNAKDLNYVISVLNIDDMTSLPGSCTYQLCQGLRWASWDSSVWYNAILRLNSRFGSSSNTSKSFFKSGTTWGVLNLSHLSVMWQTFRLKRVSTTQVIPVFHITFCCTFVQVSRETGKSRAGLLVNSSCRASDLWIALRQEEVVSRSRFLQIAMPSSTFLFGRLERSVE